MRTGGLALALCLVACGSSDRTYSDGGAAGDGLQVASGSPSSWDFGDVTVGDASPAVILALENTGDAPTGALALELDGDAVFPLGGDCGAAVLGPAATCSLQVRFAPIAVGARAATVQVSDPDGGTVEIEVSGRGVPSSAPDGGVPDDAAVPDDARVPDAYAPDAFVPPDALVPPDTLISADALSPP